jgi:hypothetical protein
MAQDSNGRRLGERTAMRARGAILGENNAVTDVYVLDQSISGIRLELPVGVSLGRRFSIKIGECLSDAEVIWRKGFQVGARFVRHDEEEGRAKAPPIVVKKMSLAELRGLARKPG